MEIPEKSPEDEFMKNSKCRIQNASRNFIKSAASKLTKNYSSNRKKKIIHIKYFLVFNNTCIKENILPKYSY